jgi:uncharacterized protein YbjT (DUF2867 family)
MEIKTIVFGASGMVGKGVLIECLESPAVASVLVIGRNTCDIKHAKLKEIIHKDFMDYTPIQNQLEGYNACYFCLGVSALGMSEKKYTEVTHDYAISTAKTLLALNPEMTFCYVSGLGTDGTEKGRSMWARVKGKTENDLLKMPFKGVYLFRPGFIQPMKGVKSKVGWYQAFYTIFKPLYPGLKKLFPRAVTSTVKVGLAMINVTLKGYSTPYLENRQINELADTAS